MSTSRCYVIIIIIIIIIMKIAYLLLLSFGFLRVKHKKMQILSVCWALDKVVYVRALLSYYSHYYYCATRMHSADYAVARCLSVVCPSHAGILSKRLYKSSKFFHQRVAPILVFHNKRDDNIMTGTPSRGRRMQGGMKKSRFSTNRSLYL